jgi:HEXXH motif-containing protein
VLRELWRTQRSRRLLLVNAVLDATNEQPDLLGPLPPGASACEALLAAERAAQAEFDAVLLHPQVGSWAAYALRRHLGHVHSDTPGWVDLGALHSFALAAAARARVRWRTRVPARAGQATLPTLGTAWFANAPRWADVEAETVDGWIALRHGGAEVVVPPDTTGDGPGWWRLRRLRVGGDPTLSVTLDDLDPFRDLADPVAPERLSDEDLRRWAALLDDAWALLCRYHREAAEAMAEGVVSLVPLPAGDGWETRSASTGEAFGSVLVSPPPDDVTLAVSLVHEFQHIKLGGLMHLGPLTSGPDEARYYAPWRDDPRPLSGLVQGIYAFVGIVAFWRDHRRAVDGTDRTLADFEFAYARSQVHDALRTASTSGRLTMWGERLVAALTDRVRPWLAEPVTPESVGAAAVAADHHRAGWRIRNCRPPSRDVEALARAWRTGSTVHIGQYRPAVTPYRDRRWSPGMLALVRQHLLDRAGALTDRLRSFDLTEADAAFVRGDVAAARAAYRARIAENAGDLGAWVGLGLAAARPLLDIPELVRATYLRVAEHGPAPDPEELARWVSRATAASVA